MPTPQPSQSSLLFRLREQRVDQTLNPLSGVRSALRDLSVFNEGWELWGGLPACPSVTLRSGKCRHEAKQHPSHDLPAFDCDGFARLCDGGYWRSLGFNPVMVRWICVYLRYLRFFSAMVR